MALRTQPTTEDHIVKRLKVIRGHLTGVENMILNQRPHQEVLTQLSAIRAAIHKVALLEAQRYVESAMNFMSEADIDDAIKQFMNLKLVTS
ncbi:MAG: metal-sensing transcriptional repressor [Desulfitobacteriaceae bacterium]|uniref:metal-sensing transcriptional repressor n=1 Tax=Desulfosporosinus sp. FKA TaxID=1969834 RepID=UPI000B49F7BC|nr:metal-sensing transcriptional repressor [Desulfosporosinus sp. FKA]MDI6877900.1 metal-sensing transcriptional repressor [Desulfitobacteriaceae bacterium]MDI6912673.1 metal-sensing transcriptional repressor [Desulfitobacteriaceae bacterium]